MEITGKKLPLGLHEESAESLTAKKSYVSPTIKVVKFVVEVGVGGSSETQPPAAGMTFYMQSRTQLNQTGDESRWQTADGNWF